MWDKDLVSPYQVHEFEALQQLAVLVLEAVGFVNDDAAPLDGVELGAAAQDHLEGGDDRLELVRPSDRSALEVSRNKRPQVSTEGVDGNNWLDVWIMQVRKADVL